ncbi:hypothetical protein JNW90_06485 [Micromonospora sp. STR1s_5]|nr:hypothetical protein [Micromonospora sp. STR1s_5]
MTHEPVTMPGLMQSPGFAPFFSAISRQRVTLSTVALVSVICLEISAFLRSCSRLRVCASLSWNALMLPSVLSSWFTRVMVTERMSTSVARRLSALVLMFAANGFRSTLRSPVWASIFSSGLYAAKASLTALSSCTPTR